MFTWLRGLDFVSWLQGYAKYHLQRETVEFHAFFIYTLEHVKIFKQFEQLQLIHKLIEAQRTGPPIEFAQRLGISPRRWYDILEELKSRGAPIVYSRTLNSYLYSEEIQIDIALQIRKVSDAEEK